MARLNRAVTNKVSIHLAGFVPGLGIVIHVGRRTRNVYRTPVIVFRTKDGFRIAMTYGRDVGLGAERARPRRGPARHAAPRVRARPSPSW